MRYMEMLRDPPVALLARRGANFTLEKDIPVKCQYFLDNAGRRWINIRTNASINSMPLPFPQVFVTFRYHYEHLIPFEGIKQGWGRGCSLSDGLMDGRISQ